jgi:hypothetical protein
MNTSLRMTQLFTNSSAEQQSSFADLVYWPLRCFTNRRMLASPASHEPELQRHAESAAHGISDEGEPSRARTGNAQGMGGDPPLPANSEIERGSRTVCSA